MTYRNRKVGGIRFIRLGRLQISLCICKPEPKRGPSLMDRIKSVLRSELYANDWALIAAALAAMVLTACAQWAR